MPDTSSSPNRLNRGDWSLIAITLLITASSVSYVSANYGAAFPQASLELPLSREQITEKAAAFLRTRGLRTDGFRNLTLFDPDHQARLYLEREVGLEKANGLMRGAVPVWQWRARWFQPPQKEEMLVWLSPDGRLTGFDHRVLETVPGRRLDSESARLLAQAFLESQTSERHRLISADKQARPNRDDHVFTFEQEGFRAAEGTLRRTVTIQGDKVGGYQVGLHVPEQWERDFNKLRSSNQLFSSIANTLYALIGAGALVLLFVAVRRHEVPWRSVMLLAGTVATLNLANELNTIAFTIDGMPTSSRYPEMVLLAGLQALGAACGILLYVGMPAAAASTLWSRVFPWHTDLPRLFTWPSLGTRSFFRAALAGLAMAAGHMAFLTAFYLIGQKWGVWSPQDVDYSDLLATPLPLLYPVATAMMASSAEEFWFRLLAIPLFQKLFRWRWVAVVVPAFIWGFLHANYPQQPGYIRGVEVGLIGVAAGVVMLRFGLAATLIWHFVIDAFLMGLFLLKGESLYFRLNTGALGLVILAPLLVALRLYWRRGGFAPELERAASIEEAPVMVEEEPVELAPAPSPPWPARYLYVTAAALVALAFALRPVTYGDFIEVKVTRAEALQTARAELAQRGVKVEEWLDSIDFAPNLSRPEIEFLRQKLGAGKANEALREIPHAVWRVRFLKPLVAEEHVVFVDQDNRVYRYDHQLDEKAAGARLPVEEARRLAQEHVAARLPGRGLALIESSEEKRDNRSDHAFVWRDPKFPGPAELRYSLVLIGDEPTQFRPYFKLPEEWLREYRKPRLTSYVGPAFVGAAGVSVVLLFLRRLSRHWYRWRLYLGVAVVTSVLTLLDQANAMPGWLSAYDTATPLDHFCVQLGTSTLLGALFTAGGLCLAVLGADVFLQAAFPLTAVAQASLARAAACAAAMAAWSSISDWLTPFRPHLWALDGLDTLVPALPLFAKSLEGALLLPSAVAVAIGAALLLLPARRRWLMLAAVLVLFAVSRSQAFGEFPGNLAVLGGTALLVLLMAFTCSTDLRSPAVGLFWALCLSQAWMLIRQPAAGLQANGAVLAVVALVTGAWLLRDGFGPLFSALKIRRPR